MRTRGLQPRLLYPARLSINIEGKIRTLPEKKKSKRIHLHETRYAREDKWAVFRKERKRKTERGTQVKKWALNKYLSIITLNVN